MKKTSLFHVKKRTLLAVAGCVWMLAGFNVARLGVLSYFVIESHWYLYLFFGTRGRFWCPDFPDTRTVPLSLSETLMVQMSIK